MCTSVNSCLGSSYYGFPRDYLRGFFMKTIETLKDLDIFLNEYPSSSDKECILRIYDNKSDVLLQTIVVKHPVIFIRGIQEFCKSTNLPVSDISVRLVGFISEEFNLGEIEEVIEISPYVYFKKPEEVSSSQENN